MRIRRYTTTQTTMQSGRSTIRRSKRWECTTEMVPGMMTSTISRGSTSTQAARFSSEFKMTESSQWEAQALIAR